MYGAIGLPELIILLFVAAVAAVVFRRARPRSTVASATSPAAGEARDSRRETAKVVLGIGAFLLICAVIRWNSVGRQSGSDELSIVLFIAAAIALWVGYRMLSAAPAPPSSRPSVNFGARTADERIRELDSLRSKQLISDAEYEDRKKQIIASV